MHCFPVQSLAASPATALFEVQGQRRVNGSNVYVTSCDFFFAGAPRTWRRPAKGIAVTMGRAAMPFAAVEHYQNSIAGAIVFYFPVIFFTL